MRTIIAAVLALAFLAASCYRLHKHGEDLPSCVYFLSSVAFGVMALLEK